MRAEEETTPLRRRLIPLLLFALAMGWVEAMVVVYIRRLFAIEHVVELDRALLKTLVSNSDFLRKEQTREAATLLMLAVVAWLTGRDLRERLGALLIVWGAWDIFYYLSLFAILRWPPSLVTSDILFLIPPTPLWVQPVWLPLLMSCFMIAGGLWLLRASSAGFQESGT